MELAQATIIFGGLALVALTSADGRWPRLFWLTKPATTLSLLLVTSFPWHDRFGVLIMGALVLSALGDGALLSEGKGFFLSGLLLFLLAHGFIIAAFVAGGGRGAFISSALAGVAVFSFATVWLLRRLYPSIEPGLRLPVLVYAATITVMVSAAYVVLAGPWPSYVTVPLTAGAVSFYLSDALLAWGLFRRGIRNQQSLNLGLYWTGQFGLAVAARFVGGA